MATEERLIDANAFKVFLEDVRQGYLEEDTFSSNFAAEVIETVQDNYLDLAPTVDAVEVVHGEWVGTRYDGYADECPVYDLWECSNCREEYESEGDPPPYNYCPNCGAKMDGDGNG